MACGNCHNLAQACDKEFTPPRREPRRSARVMGWPWQQKPSEDECVECQEAKEAPKPASSAHGPCGDLYALVDACMQREDRKNVKDCAAEWKAFQACHSAHRTRR